MTTPRHRSVRRSTHDDSGLGRPATIGGNAVDVLALGRITRVDTYLPVGNPRLGVGFASVVVQTRP